VPTSLQGPVSLLGRILLSAIFVMSALGNKIPNFDQVAGFMATAGVPFPKIALAGAIAFLIVGGASVILGYKARVGAALLLVFLALATFYFHNFWAVTDTKAQQEQMIQAMKNLSMMGAMLFIIANGSGAWSLDQRLRGSFSGTR
jgi:putative oxidoreductase